MKGDFVTNEHHWSGRSGRDPDRRSFGRLPLLLVVGSREGPVLLLRMPIRLSWLFRLIRWKDFGYLTCALYEVVFVLQLETVHNLSHNEEELRPVEFRYRRKTGRERKLSCLMHLRLI